MPKVLAPREGDLYKVIEVENRTFEIVYGFYEDDERDRIEPLPVFPDLKRNPAFTADGKPIVTGIQETCEHYSPQGNDRGEDWCGDCVHYLKPDSEISVCCCTERRLE